ncbi:MAG: winged helix-turn-helix domain-containing protein [Desulfurococcaceae archaeon]|nr:winged helix-turn-helix domain-containing protein [Desulfurococcaceae archaeon]
MIAQAEDLSRAALKIYVYLLESKDPKGVRDIARALNMPVSSVHYHLKRLEDLEIVGRRGDGYVVTKTVHFEGYVLLGRKLIPRLLIYSLFFLGVSLSQTYIVLINRTVTSDKLLLLILCLVAFTLFLLEGLNMRLKLKSL